MPPPLASTLLVDAMLLGALAFARAEAILVCGAALVFAALRTMRLARRIAIGSRLFVAYTVALGMPTEAALSAWQPSPLRTGAVAGAVALAAVYAWVTSPALRR
ncbi:MAG: hypothetical protein IPN17_21285 [Deltaproteobacteria bacterium]|nr:hypothetical protein [Deltaproteobacteria bacterium]MBK8694739.1 hypothetical protein [Deltaproteobacteria bacterium]MBP6829939.1 hypothetical protein [Deltaproteobacteria bacterium]